jgi:adenylate cyclase
MIDGLLAELKRRKVFRVAAVYGATAFLALQGADLVFPRLGLPDWTVTLVVALGVLGLPVALALAWAFDATPDGVRRTAPAEPSDLAEMRAQPRARRWAAVAAALAGVALLGGGAWWTLTGAAPRSAVYDSIAVLPFANLSGDPQDDYFGDGLAEELLNALSGIEGLKVAARTSAFALRGSQVDVRTIGDTLRVATVLEGSVRRSAGRIRIAAQLIDARTGYRLWSQSYDRPLAELFAVQDAIAAEIVNALAVQLAGGTLASELYRGGTEDVVAYDLYLQGRQKWATRQIPLLHEAVEHFEQAIARDSAFALAWSGLADGLNALAWRRDPVGLPRVDEAMYAARMSVALEPRLGEGWASWGVMELEFGRDFRMAELALRRAVELKPSWPMAHNWLADVLLYTGRAEESLAVRRRAFDNDPLSPVGRGSRAWSLAVAGRWEEARTAFLGLDLARLTGLETPLIAVSSARHLRLTPEQAAVFARDWAGRTGYSDPAGAELLGRAAVDPPLRSEARALLRHMEDEGVSAVDLAVLHAGFGERESALRLLERALDVNDPQLIMTAVVPALAPLRSEPRFQRILAALGLPGGIP